MSKNLNNKVIKTATRWQERGEQDQINRASITRAQLFALELMHYMDENNLKQRELAIKMDVSPQQVNKILRAKANLTFETLDKIAEALEVTIDSPKIIRHSPSLSRHLQTSMQVVYKRLKKSIVEDINTASIKRKNPLLHPTLENMKPYEFTALQI